MRAYRRQAEQFQFTPKFTECVTGSLPAVNCKLEVPEAKPPVLKLKMYPPVEPSVASKRKSLSGFALPGESGVPEKPETALTDMAWTTIAEEERSLPFASQSWSLMGNVAPLLTDLLWSKSGQMAYSTS